MPVQRGEPERHVVDRDDTDGPVPGAGHMDHVLVDPRQDDGRGRARERRAARALRRPLAADALAHRRIRGPGRAANQPSPVSLQKTFRTGPCAAAGGTTCFVFGITGTKVWRWTTSMTSGSGR